MVWTLCLGNGAAHNGPCPPTLIKPFLTILHSHAQMPAQCPRSLIEVLSPGDSTLSQVDHVNFHNFHLISIVLATVTYINLNINNETIK